MNGVRSTGAGQETVEMEVLSFKADSILEGTQDVFDRVISPENVPIPFETAKHFKSSLQQTSKMVSETSFYRFPWK